MRKLPNNALERTVSHGGRKRAVPLDVQVIALTEEVRKLRSELWSTRRDLIGLMKSDIEALLTSYYSVPMPDGLYGEEGFAYPEGLRRHLAGSYNARQCAVVKAAIELAWDHSERKKTGTSRG